VNEGDEEREGLEEALAADVNVQAARSVFDDLVRRYPDLQASQRDFYAAFTRLREALRGGRKVLVCGNGGSASDAEHIAGELGKSMNLPRPIEKAERERLFRLADAETAEYLARHLERGWPVWPLGSQGALVTAIANDTAGDMIFAQQVQAYGTRGDILWAISTSGRSRNVLLAAVTARALGMDVVSMTGPGGGPLADLATVALRVGGATVQETQERHLPLYHALCAALELDAFGGGREASSCVGAQT